MSKDSIVPPAILAVMLGLSMVSCGQENAADGDMDGSGLDEGQGGETDSLQPLDAASVFRLKPEVDLAALQKSETVDVNLGQSPEVFIQAIWKQFSGEMPATELVQRYETKFGSMALPRRIDLAVALAKEAGLTPVWHYSDPWRDQVDLEAFTGKAVARDIGAVFMFFFTSPDPPNGGPGWANNHVPGMFEPNPAYHLDDSSGHIRKNGLYHPENVGFWYRELKDASHAGLDFALLNVYGPDLESAQMEPLRHALQRLAEEPGAGVPRIGLFDDTWTWGQPWFGPFWEQKPDCLEVESTARLLFRAKWKPFFEAIPREHWYLVGERPMIYFYNSNTLQNRENFYRVLPVMKALFKQEFGMEPWVAVDTAFNYSAAMREVSDSQFRWYTLDLPPKYAKETRNNLTLSHSMVRWDPVSRANSNKERRVRPDEMLVKDDAILKQVLNETRDSDILVLATWNDLGEGTGINRCFDYYWDGEWKQPTHFMNLIRRSQAGELLE